MKNKSGFNAGRKKATTGADRNKLDKITKYLNDNHTGVHVSKSNHHVKNEIFKTGVRETDLLLNNKVHLQHDTVTVHCELGYENVQFEAERSDKDKKRVRTKTRNGEYWQYWMETGNPFVVINQDLAKMLGLDEGPLTAYLYYHAMMLDNARREME
jgi:hypothetical protein